MRKLFTKLLAQLITTNRKRLSLTQQALADATGINRSLISRIEKEDFLSYSVKPKSIDFTGFDDIYLPQNKSRE